LEALFDVFRLRSAIDVHVEDMRGKVSLPKELEDRGDGLGIDREKHITGRSTTIARIVDEDSGDPPLFTDPGDASRSAAPQIRSENLGQGSQRRRFRFFSFTFSSFSSSSSSCYSFSISSITGTWLRSMMQGIPHPTISSSICFFFFIATAKLFVLFLLAVMPCPDGPRCRDGPVPGDQRREEPSGEHPAPSSPELGFAKAGVFSAQIKRELGF
jgi:hypothetical protein